MRLSWKELYQERHEAYESDYKIIVDRYPFRSGKTITFLLYCLENNINSIALYDNHKLLMEIYNQLKHLLPAIIRKRIINILIGKGHLNSDSAQILFKIPPYLCLALNKYNNLTKFKKGYMLNNYCSEICTYQKYKSCPYKAHMRRAFIDVEKYPDVSSMWLAPKAYLSTGILNAVTEKISNIHYLNDEDLFNQIYKQINIDPGSIHDFMKFITFISTRYRTLKDFRVLIVEWLVFLYDILVVNIQKRVNKKIEDISKYLLNILESWKVEDLINDNEKFKELAGDHMHHIHKTYNMIPSLIRILEDVEKNEEFNKQIVIDKKEYSFSYFINLIEPIKELIKEFKQVVFADRNYMPNFIETVLPEYSDNHLILGDESKNQINKNYFKNVYILHKNWADNTRDYGTYPKFNLWSYYDGYNERFYELVNLSNQAIEHEANNKYTSGLLITHKQFIKKFKELNEPIVKEFGVDMEYNHYKNIKGLMYPDRNYGIIASSFNVPLRFRKVLNVMYGFDMAELEWQFGPGEYLQAAGRLQDPDRDKNNLPNLYVLTNAYTGYFDKEINFNGFTGIKYKHIINYIKKGNWVRTKDIMEYIGKSIITTKNILKVLYNEGYIKWKKGESSPIGGRPPDMWNVNQNKL